MKKKLLLALSLFLTLTALLGLSISAKEKLPPISKDTPLITYTYNSSGKVYAYDDSDLKTKTGGYIACATDECKIIKISGNAVKVTYPISNGKTRTAWFSREAFTYRDLAKDAAKSTFTAKTSVTTYRWKNNYTTFGSVATGDKCYLLRGDKDSEWVQIIYPVSKGHKMGWVTGADYADMTGTAPKEVANASQWQWPMKNYRITQSFNHYSSSKAKDGRPYHIGIDMVSSNTNIYAAADGKIIYKDYSSGNGYHIIIEHNLNGTKVKTLYSHLKNLNSCPKVGTTVKKGTKIGVMGNTGFSIGAHLHFAIFTGSSTNPDGYAQKSGSNKITHKNCTFYNPAYVIKYNKLP